MYSPGPSSLTTASDRSGSDRVGGLSRQHEVWSATGSGVRGSFFPSSCARSTMRSHRSRASHDSPDRRDVMLLQKRRHRLVGRDHEILDQVGGAVPLGLLDPRHLTVGGYRACFDGLDLQRSLRQARLAQRGGDGGLHPQLRLHTCDRRATPRAWGRRCRATHRRPSR